VLVGKYVGIITSALMAIAILGVILLICTWLRIPGDHQLRTSSIDEQEVRQIWEMRVMHISGLVPSLLLMWLQIAVLAAIGVALSTRFSLVVNLPVVIILYIAGNLTRFMFPIVFSGADANTPLAGRSAVVKSFAWIISLLLPYLETFDLRQRTVYSVIRLAGTVYADDPRGVYMGDIWSYTAVAAAYAICYAAFALGLGMWLFEGRELGGGEG
jgi:hypothetical protein